MNLNLPDEYFGTLLPLIKDEMITDICWNGNKLWVDHLEKGRYITDIKLEDEFVSMFSQRVSNVANKNFNMSVPLLEAETDDLRISILHDSVSNTGISISIRKTPAVRRLNDDKMIKEGYAERELLQLFEMFVKGHCSTIVTGDVGSGKTEFVKYLTKHIPLNERTISIEDNFELRLASINPGLDAVEIKAVGDRFNYSMAIKAALRQLCKWLLLSEARSTEVVQLLEAASTGCIVMTTIHSDDVRKIPDRIVNMMGLAGEEKRNDVYNFFDVGVKIDIQKTTDGIKRNISQICVLDRYNEENALTVIYDQGFTGEKLPYNIWKKIIPFATNEQKELFDFLKPENYEELNNRYGASALNTRAIDKGKTSQVETTVNLQLSKEDIKDLMKEDENGQSTEKKTENNSDTEDVPLEVINTIPNKLSKKLKKPIKAKKDNLKILSSNNKITEDNNIASENKNLPVVIDKPKNQRPSYTKEEMKRLIDFLDYIMQDNKIEISDNLKAKIYSYRTENKEGD